MDLHEEQTKEPNTMSSSENIVVLWSWKRFIQIYVRFYNIIEINSENSIDYYFLMCKI